MPSTTPAADMAKFAARLKTVVFCVLTLALLFCVFGQVVLRYLT